MTRWNALVLAGSRGGADPVADAAGVAFKAFAPIVGRPMIAWPLAALAASERIGAVHVSINADAPALPEGAVAERIAPAASPATSVLAAFEALGAPLLITTADHALLSPAMLAAFLEGAEASGADVAAGVARREVVEQAGTTARRTYIRLSDADWSGCNLFALATPAAAKAVAFWRRLEAKRKNPMAMARAIGPVAMAAYAAGRLSTARAEALIGRATGTRAALVEMRDPLAAHDVDKPEDLAFAEARLGEGGQP
ncbi:MAG: NTP transferase domain-containing protein [Pseudomonadota bacterium]